MLGVSRVVAITAVAMERTQDSRRVSRVSEELEAEAMTTDMIVLETRFRAEGETVCRIEGGTTEGGKCVVAEAAVGIIEIGAGHSTKTEIRMCLTAF